MIPLFAFFMFWILISGLAILVIVRTGKYMYDNFSGVSSFKDWKFDLRVAGAAISLIMLLTAIRGAIDLGRIMSDPNIPKPGSWPQAAEMTLRSSEILSNPAQVMTEIEAAYPADPTPEVQPTATFTSPAWLVIVSLIVFAMMVGIVFVISWIIGQLNYATGVAMVAYVLGILIAFVLIIFLAANQLLVINDATENHRMPKTFGQSVAMSWNMPNLIIGDGDNYRSIFATETPAPETVSEVPAIEEPVVTEEIPAPEAPIVEPTAEIVAEAPTEAPTEEPTAVPPTASPTAPAPTATTAPAAAECGGIGATTLVNASGQVDKNYDGGDQILYTWIRISEPENPNDIGILMPPGFSMDVESKAGKMMNFTNYTWVKESSLADLFCLLNNSTAKTKIWYGPELENLPAGWVTLENAPKNSWFTLKGWQYTEAIIQPCVAEVKTVVYGPESTDRTLKSGDALVYGQFWTTANPGTVVHIQVQPDQEFPLPAHWQGTLWEWHGLCDPTQEQAQKRFIQATFKEVVDRDEVTVVKLYVYGNLPTDVDSKFMEFDFNGQLIKWEPPQAPWVK